MSQALKNKCYINSPPDLIIDCKGKLFQVHLINLACISPYFKKLLEYECQRKIEKCEESLIIQMDIPEDILSEVIAFAYSGKITLSADNFELMTVIADQYNIVGIVKQSADFLKRNIVVENCIGLYLFTKNLFCYDLQSELENFILKNFEAIYQRSVEFSALVTKDILSHFLANHFLQTTDELHVWQSVVSWVQYNEGERLKDLYDLCKNVRFGLIGLDQLDNILLHHYVKACKKTRTLLKKVVKVKRMATNATSQLGDEQIDPRIKLHMTPRH